ncbi:MAG: dienelactone hydrolase family protein [Minwuia sp.]|nr:dienelactone hydrolase family protein [Minwuia sp.]
MGLNTVITTKDGEEFGGYLAMPKSGSGPGVVVIQEIFGVNDVMRGTADWLASEGFVALCPDLFWRIEPGIELTDKTEADWGRAFECFKAFDVQKGMEDVQATIDSLRQVEGCTGKIGATGYCLGGLLAYLTMTRTDADAASGYYGVGIADMLDEAASITGPLILHVPTEDGFVPKEAQQAMHAALDGHGNVTLHDYPGQDHAFARQGGEHYDKASADTANARTLELFRSALV